MKSFRIKTKVNASFGKVWQGFDYKLFTALQPSFPRTEVKRFDGCLPGNEVHTVLHFLGMKQVFNARIINREENTESAYFTDEGTQMPFFLSYWKHKHKVEKNTENTSHIIDEITFTGPNAFTEAFFYPIIYSQMLLRKPIYKKYFSGK